MTKRELIVQAALDRSPPDYIGSDNWRKCVCGYVMGATGWVCTQARLDAQARQYPSYAVKIAAYGPRWIGKKCYDCAQLVRVCALAAGYKMVSGANSQWTKTEWAETGTIDTLPADSRGLFLYRLEGGRAKHTAVSVGDGTEVEAMGHAYGVVRREIKSRTFTHWAKLKGLDGEEVPEVTQPEIVSSYPTLMNGSRGEYVKALQNLLIAAGQQLPRWGVDGAFGAETETAVKAFQGLNALKVDGVVRGDTWDALVDYEDDLPEEKAAYTLMLTESEYKAIVAQYGEAVRA